jgi:hypothetical protein
MVIASSPRPQNLTIYIIDGFGSHQDLLTKLGNHKTSVSCLYVFSLTAVNHSIQRSIIEKSYKNMESRNK